MTCNHIDSFLIECDHKMIIIVSAITLMIKLEL